MKILKLCSIAVIVFALITVVAMASQPGLMLQALQPILSLYGPNEVFIPEEMAPEPDYSRSEFWASLPNRNDPADLVPIETAYSNNQGSAPADVFYIHPTGDLEFKQWTAAIQPGTATDENTNFFLANEASIFNSCCDIYAPRYRQASAFTYFGATPKERDQVLSAVYEDIEAAFSYFVEHFNRGRPFIIASHSQGTHHAMRLIEEVIDATELAERMVVAYTLGSAVIPLSSSYLTKLKTISICEHALDLRCVVHWDTYGQGGTARIFATNEPSLCTNPLTWRVDEAFADASLHLGAVPVIGGIQGLTDNGAIRHFAYKSLGEPMKYYTWAKCEDGTLYVADQSDQDYIKLGWSPDKSYHGLDFIMFHMNIRANSHARVQTFLSSSTD